MFTVRRRFAVPIAVLGILLAGGSITPSASAAIPPARIVHLAPSTTTAAVDRSVTVSKAPSKTVGSTKRVPYGTSAKVTFKVTGAGATPTGRLTVSEHGVKQSVGVLAHGTAVVKMSPRMAVGTHHLTLTYGGDTDHTASSTSLNLIVDRAAVKLHATTVRATYGTSEKFTITVSGPLTTPTGVVAVANGAAKVVATLSKGHAVVSLPKTWGPWSKNLAVRYSGSTNDRPAAITVKSVILRAGSRTTATGSKVTSTQRAKVSVTVSGAGAKPAGSVTVKRAGTGSWTVKLSSGHGSTLLPVLKAGTYVFAARYNGDARHNPSTASVTVKVSAAAKPAPPKTVSPPKPTPPPVAAPVYANCTDVWNRLGRSIYPSDPGFQAKFDRDGDGIGCEEDPR